MGVDMAYLDETGLSYFWNKLKGVFVRQDAKIDALRGKSTIGKNVVCIGDSYGRGVGGTDGHGWPYYMQMRMQPENFLNVSNSGAGFVKTGHSDGLSGLAFSGQVDYAAANLPIGLDAADVDFVIIAGGYNDHGQSGIETSAKTCFENAHAKFPNARLVFFPLAAGDTELSSQFAGSYDAMIYGSASGGAQVFADSMYWLYPWEHSTSYGDGIHPNDAGYQAIGTRIAGCVDGGDIPAETGAYGISAAGYSVPSGVSAAFRCGVQSGLAWLHGSFTRRGTGVLCTLPMYIRPRATDYWLAFAYADSTHHGVARIKVSANGEVTFYALESGTYSASLDWTVYLPPMVFPIGHAW
jgi:lysophospholipase L1-like esterase